MRRFRAVALGLVALVAGLAVVRSGAGVASPHSVYAFGAPFHGSTGLVGLNEPLSAMAALPDGSGYWAAQRDGRIIPFGAAPWLGDAGVDPAKPVVGLASTPSGQGLWMVSSDGDVRAFGDAAPLGTLVGVVGARDVVGIAAKPGGGGYWLVTNRGAVFTFGSAAYYGSTEGVALNQPVTGIASTASGQGYWLLGRDGGVFSFGDAAFRGSLGATGARRAVVSIARSAGGNGYLLASSDGGVFTFGDAAFHGSLGANPLPEPVVALTMAPTGGYWLTTSGHLARPGSPRPQADYLDDGANALASASGAKLRPTTYRQVDATANCSFTIADANGNRFAGGGPGRNVVRVRPSDKTFTSQGCGVWSTDLFPATATLDAPVADGAWLLGIDIRSGTWRTTGGSPGCSWQAVADLSGLSTGVLRSGGGAAPQEVQLAGSELALVSHGCGVWTPV